MKVELKIHLINFVETESLQTSNTTNWTTAFVDEEWPPLPCRPSEQVSRLAHPMRPTAELSDNLPYRDVETSSNSKPDTLSS